MVKRKYPYLNDSKFLTNLINQNNTVYFVKIMILTWDEKPVKDITGKAISASISVDGKSAMRRSANLSFVIEDDDQDAASLFELDKKIYLQIGYENYTNQYRDYSIIWFPLGLYIINTMSFTHNLTGITFSLGLKDKMCLLNGQCGGIIPAATVFDNYQTKDENGDITIVYPTIYQIIVELLNHFGGEQLGNIIIADLDTRIKQLMQWSGDVPLYVLQYGGQGGYLYTTDEADAVKKIQDEGYQNVVGSPFEAGANIGFFLTDFTYPGDLIGNAGDTVVTILDKIKSVLGNYEYFYDLDGAFRFQEIKNYLNNAQSKYLLEGLRHGKLIPDYLDFGEAYLLQLNDGKAVFSFKENNGLVTSYSSTPQLQNIKNDFVVWGLRKTVSGNQIPIRYHLAIDYKPKIGNTYKVIKYVDAYDETMEKWYCPVVYSSKSLFPNVGLEGIIYQVYQNPFKQYYMWKKVNNLSQYVQINNVTEQEITTTDWRTELYFQGIVAQANGTDSNFYYPELLSEWPKIYDIENGRFRPQVIKDSSQIDYYLDFINPVSEKMRKIAIGNIGRRSVILNKNNDINCVFESYVPDVILIKIDYVQGGADTDMSKLRDECEARGYIYSQIGQDIYNYLVPGFTFNSAYEEVRQMLYQYVSYNENISLQTLPIYFLEPNTCIQVEDKNTYIKGNYIINSLLFSLDISGNLSINANKMLERF